MLLRFAVGGGDCSTQTLMQSHKGRDERGGGVILAG